MAVAFGPFVLALDARQLLRGREAIHLSPKALELLILLVQRRPTAVAKADLHRHLWPDTFVADINLPVLVAEIRAALGETSRDARYIRTLNRFGYAFAGDASDIPEPRGGTAHVEPCWIAWGAHRATLAPGENLLGRDPAADIRIDSAGVSRRHAIITVAGGAVTLHDLSSKNGTFVGEIRVSAPVALTDGMRIHVGPVPIVFRRAGGAAVSTETVGFTPRGAEKRR